MGSRDDSGRSDYRVQAATGVIEHGFDLQAPDSGEPGKEVIDRCSVFQVFEQRRYRHTCPAEDPGTTHLARIVFHRRALRPIEHLYSVWLRNRPYAGMAEFAGESI